MAPAAGRVVSFSNSGTQGRQQHRLRLYTASLRRKGAFGSAATIATGRRRAMIPPEPGFSLKPTLGLPVIPPRHSTWEIPMSNPNQNPGQQNQNPGQKPGQQQGGGQKPGQQQQDPNRQGQNPPKDR
jgi:hypothetical protein